MGKTGYAYQGPKEGIVRAQAVDLRISPKESYEVANALRGMNVAKAKKYLEDVIALKRPIPYRRYNRQGVGHRKGHFGPGRFPKNTSEEFLKLLNLLQANAAFKGLNKEQLILFHIASHKAAPVRHSFKGSPHMTQVTHLEIVAKEETSGKKLAVKAEAKKTEKKVEKKEEHKHEKKIEVKKS